MPSASSCWRQIEASSCTEVVMLTLLLLLLPSMLAVPLLPHLSSQLTGWSLLT
jgi:hypothetical protein